MTEYRIKKTTRRDGDIVYTIEYKNIGDDTWRGVRDELYYKLPRAKKAIDKLRGNQIEDEEIIDY